MAASAAATQTALPSKKAGADIKVLLSAQSCTACHGMKQKLVGPGFAQVADKYQGKPDAVAYLANKIKAGGSGVWGAVPMPAQAQLSDQDARAIAEWLAAGAK
jgi:cytochrome c551/c552